MKLKAKLFLIVGVLFIIGFSSTFFLDTYLTKSHLEKAKDALIEEISSVNDTQRKHLEEYLHLQISRAQGAINAVLSKIAFFDHVLSGFTPSQQNKELHTWLNTTSLRITNSWIDYIQNTAGEEILAAVNVAKEKKNTLRYKPLSNEVVYVLASNEDSPLIGIRIQYEFELQKEVNIDTAYFALFTPESLLAYEEKQNYIQVDLSLDFLDPFLKWIDTPSRKSFIQPFIERVVESKQRIQKEIELYSSIEEWKAATKQQVLGWKADEDWGPPGKHIFTQVMSSSTNRAQEPYYTELVSSTNEIGMAWGIATLIASGAFTRDPFAKQAPVGLAHLVLPLPVGEALFSSEVFSMKKAPLEKRCSLNTSFCLNGDLELIKDPETGQVFIGNTLWMKGDGNVGTLTIGVDSRRFLRDLAQASHQITAVIHGGTILEVVDGNGNEVPARIWRDQVNPKQLLSSSTGIISVDGVEYYFLHVKPFPYLDLHYFILKLKSIEFELVNNITQATSELIQNITTQIRYLSIVSLLVVLAILHYVARNITKPIEHLVKATQHVLHGKLDEIAPDEVHMKQKDEVGSLYTAFFEMVQGLKEKEKVRGILNKVVSKEIAEETLKGNIHLGGEEKYVTVLFADIRRFTAITESMPPAEVIQLLNECMTRVSRVIDGSHGVIDKYVGDEVMALFGAPVERKESADEAVKAALEIHSTLREWNQQRAAKGLVQIQMHIGIHTGVMLAGNMGAENRLNYTVLGSNVNLASRLCSAASEDEVLISEDTMEALHNKELYSFERKPEVQLKGFTKEIAVYAVKKRV